MTPETRATVVATLGKRHDDLLADLYRERFGDLAKGRFDNRRTELARELRALRRAMRELTPRRYPAWMSRPEHAAEAYAVEGR